MLNWVAALRGATFRLHTDASATAIACTPLLAPLSGSAWRTAFPATTAVRDYPKPKVTDVPWNSYPAHRTPDHAIEAHYASVFVPGQRARRARQPAGR